MFFYNSYLNLGNSWVIQTESFIESHDFILSNYLFIDFFEEPDRYFPEFSFRSSDAFEPEKIRTETNFRIFGVFDTNGQENGSRALGPFDHRRWSPPPIEIKVIENRAFGLVMN